MQQATLGHRGRTYDSLYRIRKLLMTAAEQLTERGRARLRGRVPWSGGIEGVVVNLSDVLELVARS
jgi:hypothetical protein